MKKREYAPDTENETEKYVVSCGGIQPTMIPEDMEGEEEE